MCVYIRVWFVVVVVIVDSVASSYNHQVIVSVYLDKINVGVWWFQGKYSPMDITVNCFEWFCKNNTNLFCMRNLKFKFSSSPSCWWWLCNVMKIINLFLFHCINKWMRWDVEMCACFFAAGQKKNEFIFPIFRYLVFKRSNHCNWFIPFPCQWMNEQQQVIIIIQFPVFPTLFCLGKIP